MKGDKQGHNNYASFTKPCLVYQVPGHSAPNLARVPYTALAWNYGDSAWLVVQVNPHLMGSEAECKGVAIEIENIYRRAGFFGIISLGYYENGIMCKPSEITSQAFTDLDLIR